MTNQRNTIHQHGSALGFRALLGVEVLESRVLLAGLVNLSDNLLHSPSVHVDSVPAEVRQIEIQSVETGRGEVNVASTGEVDRSTFTESVWSPNRDRPADAREPSVVHGTVDGTSCDKDAADREEECASSDFTMNAGGSSPPGTIVMAPVIKDGAHPVPVPLPVSQPSFIAVVVTPSSTQEIRPPLPSATIIARSSLSPSTVPPLPFHYFTPSPKLDHGSEFTLHSQPLADAAVRETFVAFSLLEASGVHQNLAKQAAKKETISNTSARHVETSVSKQADLTNGDHLALVDKALAAIAQATEVLQDSVAISVAHRSQVESNDSWVDPSLASALAAAPCRLNHSPIENSSVSQDFNNRVQLGLISLASILLSLKSPLTMVRNVGAARGGWPRKICCKLFCR